jgi:serine/threonine-protein kinase
VKVLDFGIAKMADEDARAGSLTIAGGILGTPVYMAPERFRGEAIDGASDVYSVGVMLYQMLTGRVPFVAPDSDLMAIVMMHLHREPPPLSEADPEIAPEIDRIVLSALRKDPRQRPAIASLAASFAGAAGRDDVADANRRTVRPAGDVTPEGEATAAQAEPTQHMVRPRPGPSATGKKRERGK